jgi:FAD/FMN-containing dehydrogenase
MMSSDSDVPSSGDERVPRPTRRSFVAGGIATAGLGALVGSRRTRDSVASGARSGKDPWELLARSISGPVVRPGDPGYAALALPFNPRVASIMPAGIALCRSAEDVATSIRWARKYNFPLISRSGGHSAAGYSVTTGLMIDIKLMKQATFDTETRVATITHGRCPAIGASGFLLGGGVGLNIRTLGIGSDTLVAGQIVAADGEIATLSDKENSDLFWACRGGGGGNFGINTSFSIRTVPAPSFVTAARLIWTTKIDKVFPALLAALYESPVSQGRNSLLRRAAARHAS